MLRKKITVLVMVLVMLAFAISSAFAGEGYGSSGASGGKLEQKLYKKIKFLCEHKEMVSLSDKQLEQLKELKLSTKKSIIQNNADIEITMVDINAGLYSTDKIDLKTVEKLIDQKYKFKTQKAKTLVRAYARLMDILTQEQREMLKDIGQEGFKKKTGCMQMMPTMPMHGSPQKSKCPMMQGKEAAGN